MTHFIGNIHVFDVMDRIHLSATVTDIDAQPTSEARGFVWSTTVRGSGESDIVEWLRDALMHAIEDL